MKASEAFLKAREVFDAHVEQETTCLLTAIDAAASVGRFACVVPFEHDRDALHAPASFSGEVCRRLRQLGYEANVNFDAKTIGVGWWGEASEARVADERVLDAARSVTAALEKREAEAGGDKSGGKVDPVWGHEPDRVTTITPRLGQCERCGENKTIVVKLTFQTGHYSTQSRMVCERCYQRSRAETGNVPGETL